MQDLTAHILKLIRLASTSLPAGIEKFLSSANDKEEENSSAQGILHSILQNINIARETSTPLCQDTGTPTFFVRCPASYSTSEITGMIRAAVAQATEKQYLRPNAVDALTGENSGNNLGDKFFPVIHFEHVSNDTLSIDLLLKGGGCENVSRQYSLPDENLKADRDLEGVRKVALDTVFRAQGRGCAPGFLAITVGGDRATSYLASKELLLEDFTEHHPNPEIASLEKRITREASELGIGPMGLGGQSTILATRITGLHRLPASFFVSVSYMCWAFRRRRLTIADGKAVFK